MTLFRNDEKNSLVVPVTIVEVEVEVEVLGSATTLALSFSPLLSMCLMKGPGNSALG